MIKLKSPKIIYNKDQIINNTISQLSQLSYIPVSNYDDWYNYYGSKVDDQQFINELKNNLIQINLECFKSMQLLQKQQLISSLIYDDQNIRFINKNSVINNDQIIQSLKQQLYRSELYNGALLQVAGNPSDPLIQFEGFKTYTNNILYKMRSILFNNINVDKEYKINSYHSVISVLYNVYKFYNIKTLNQNYYNNKFQSRRIINVDPNTLFNIGLKLSGTQGSTQNNIIQVRVHLTQDLTQLNNNNVVCDILYNIDTETYSVQSKHNSNIEVQIKPFNQSDTDYKQIIFKNIDSISGQCYLTLSFFDKPIDLNYIGNLGSVSTIANTTVYLSYIDVFNL